MTDTNLHLIHQGEKIFDGTPNVFIKKEYDVGMHIIHNEPNKFPEFMKLIPVDDNFSVTHEFYFQKPNDAFVNIENKIMFFDDKPKTKFKLILQNHKGMGKKVQIQFNDDLYLKINDDEIEFTNDPKDLTTFWTISVGNFNNEIDLRKYGIFFPRGVKDDNNDYFYIPLIILLIIIIIVIILNRK